MERNNNFNLDVEETIQRAQREIEEKFQRAQRKVEEKLQDYCDYHRRVKSIEIDILEFWKHELKCKNVEKVEYLKLTTDEKGMPEKLVFNVLKPGGVVLPEYAKSTAYLGKDGRVEYSMSLGSNLNNFNNRGFNGFSSAFSNVFENVKSGSNRFVNVKGETKTNGFSKISAIISIAAIIFSVCSFTSAKTYKEEIAYMETVLKDHNLVIKGKEVYSTNKNAKKNAKEN